MNKAALGALIVLLLLLSYPADGAEVTVSHYYDQNGNVISGPGKPSSSNRVQRYTVPEGISLRHDILYEQYPVFGSSFSEIIRSIKENGPYSRKKDSRTATDISWTLGLSYKFSFTSELEEDTDTIHISISVSDIAFDCRVKVVVPALMDESGLNPVEKNLWKRYFESLLEYEYCRVNIIKDPHMQTSLSNGIRELNYLSLEYSPNLDLDSIVRSTLREETEGMGQEWAKTIKDRIDAYNKPSP